MKQEAMKHAKILAASGFAICLFLLAAPAMAQNTSQNTYGNRNDHPGPMPADRSTPAERAATAALNRQISSANQEADAQAAQDQERYRKQRAQYEEQAARYRDAMQHNRLQQRDYRARRAAYEALRAHYADRRAAYRRHDWPDHHHWTMVGRDTDPVGTSVLLPNGEPAGRAVDVARSPDGHLEAIQVRLEGGKEVWIDTSDLRFDRAGGILMTDLDRRDLSEMADERL